MGRGCTERKILVDIVPPAPSEADVKAHYYRVDLTDYGQVVASFTEHDSLYKGMDAVIHLAAIPSPGHAVSQLNPNSLLTSRGVSVVSKTKRSPTTLYSTQISDRHTTSSKRPVCRGSNP